MKVIALMFEHITFQIRKTQDLMLMWYVLTTAVAALGAVLGLNSLFYQYNIVTLLVIVVDVWIVGAVLASVMLKVMLNITIKYYISSGEYQYNTRLSYKNFISKLRETSELGVRILTQLWVLIIPGMVMAIVLISSESAVTSIEEMYKKYFLK